MTEACEILAAADSTAVADINIETQQAVEQFLYRQAEMLDEKRIDEQFDRLRDAGVTDLNAAIIPIDEGAEARTLDFLQSRL